jgi:hypothetical protein
MTRTSNNLTIAFVEQQTLPEYWGWATNPALAALLDGPADPLTEYLVGLLEAGGCKVVEAYGIVHDKDHREAWDPAARDIVIEPKPRHVHAMFRFASRNDGATLSHVAVLLGVEAQYVEKPGRGPAWDNKLAYLVHIKYPEKCQYNISEVATVRGPEYAGVAALRWQDWLRGRAVVQAKANRSPESLESVRARVLSGELTMEQIMLTDDLFAIYSASQTSRSEIDGAFQIAGTRRAVKAMVKLGNHEFSTMVVFVYGLSDSGKTFLAKSVCDEAIRCAAGRGERWGVYRAATTNVLDDWLGHEILLLDDLRAASMRATDWLLLLDPDNASPASARYKNKQAVAPRLIVITSTIEPVEFFFYARQKGDVDEALDQFLRRLMSVVQVVREPAARRYFVHEIGPVKPYRMSVRNLFPYDHLTAVNLAYGATRVVEHSFAGAVSRLVLDLAGRSPDMGFANADDWANRQALVAAETAQSNRRGFTLYEADRWPLVLKTHKPRALAGLPAKPHNTPVTEEGGLGGRYD